MKCSVSQKRINYLVLIVIMLLVLSACQVGNKTEDYLFRDGKLKAQIKIERSQGGFAGVTGTRYIIEADGSWSYYSWSLEPNKSWPIAQGKLTREQLVQLAKEFARYDLVTLPNHGGKAMANPTVVRIQFGEKVSELLLERNSTEAITARYTGIVAAVEMLCQGNIARNIGDASKSER